MFLIKKIVSWLLEPLTLTLISGIVGVALLWFTRQQRVGKALVTAAVTIMFFGSCTGVAEMLLRPLENQYPPYTFIEADAMTSPIRFVVVLAGGQISDPTLPVTTRLTGESMQRLVEGIRIHAWHPGSQLVFSGGPAAEEMAEVARGLRVADTVIHTEVRSRDTREQAEILGPVLGRAPFILVTSAVHMPRAMGMFRRRRLIPIPAPTAHRVGRRIRVRVRTFLPSPSSLRDTHAALHEYLGLLWGKLRRQI